jgi:ent-copalyl diphosphate synthase
MHSIPTSILYSLEGMPGLDWKKLLKLQSCDGSFLCSPSATAYALIQTGDKKCLEYLNMIVTKFNGGGKSSIATHQIYEVAHSIKCYFVTPDCLS